MVTVLDKLTRADFANATLVSQLQASAEERITERTEAIASRFGQKISAVELERKPWEGVKDSAGEASSFLSDTLGRARRVKDALDGMIASVTKATQNTEGFTNFEGYALTFDSQLGNLVRIAQNGSSPNLLGTAEPTFRYDISPNFAQASVKGADLGSDYYIEDTEGKLWYPNRGARNLTRYDDYPNTPTSTVGAFGGGLQLDSLVGDTVTFTVGPDTGSPESFTGTIYRDDLRIVDSWFYDGLATADGRERALEAINDAKDAVKLEIRRYEVAISVAQFYEKRAQTQISGLNAENNELLVQQAQEIQKAQDDLARQFQATTSNVAVALSLRVEYANLFAPFVNDRFSSVFIDLLA